MTKIAGSGSGYIIQRHGSADPDPDLPQNVMNPQHCFLPIKLSPSSQKYGFGIRDPGSEIRKKPIPDPGVIKAPYPGSGSATQDSEHWYHINAVSIRNTVRFMTAGQNQWSGSVNISFVPAALIRIS
jgi:hypothetical protein